MLLKAVGMMCTIAASSAIGFKVASNLEGRLKDLRNLQLSLQILEKEMVFLSNPLQHALISASKVEGGVSDIFRECGEVLKKKQGYCVSDVWDVVLNKNFRNTYLNDEDKNILIGLGKCLGLYDIQSQTQNIRLIASQLALQEKKAEEIITKSAKMYKNLGVLAGAAITIVLL